ncbi:MAG TPA: acetate--CoA ligase family protein, partial [Thermoanaerobaculia bacterium]
ELFDVALALDRCPLPEGNRVGIVTNAGGPAIMATDACVNQGLRMAELAAATRERLAAFLPPAASLANPVDMIASATVEQYGAALAAVLDDPGVDLAMVINVTPLLANPIGVLEEAGRVAAARAKPVLAVMMATEEFYAAARERRHLPPVYHFPEPAARALAMLARYAAWRRRPADEPPPEFPADGAAVAAILEAAARREPGGYLDPAETFRVLELYGVPVAPWRVAATPEEAAAAAGELGFPAALKAIAPGLVHKSDVGAVRLGLEDAGEVAAAAAEMRERLTAAGLRLAGYVVQPMVRGGHEVIFGVSTDPRFGPLLMFGLGGKYVEVFQDVRFAVPPLAPHEAHDLVRGIRGFPLLAGVRGEPGADLAVLEEVVLRIAQLVQRHLSIQELDVNPFLAAPERENAVALDARIRVGTA